MKEEQESQPITVSEAYHLLAPIKGRYKNTRSESFQIYKKTLEYTEMFCKIQDKSAISDLKLCLEELGFTKEEISILGSLLPQTADEAKIYMPSISRLNDTSIYKAIEKIQSIFM